MIWAGFAFSGTVVVTEMKQKIEESSNINHTCQLLRIEMWNKEKVKSWCFLVCQCSRGVMRPCKFPSPSMGPGQSPGGVQGAKPSKAGWF